MTTTEQLTAFATLLQSRAFPSRPYVRGTVSYEIGKRYARFVEDGYAVLVFVDIATGVIYKPASFKKATKTVYGKVAS